MGRTPAPSLSRSPPASGRMYSPLRARSTPAVSSVLRSSSWRMVTASASRSPRLCPDVDTASCSACPSVQHRDDLYEDREKLLDQAAVSPDPSQGQERCLLPL